MSYFIESFKVQRSSKAFNDSRFDDSSFLRSYFKRNNNDKIDRLDYVDFFASVIECFSRIRGLAETVNNEKGFYEVKDYKGTLPIGIKEIHSCIHDDKSEAPQELISVIAQKHFNLIKSLGESMRKILRRERNKIGMGKAQQMDSQCLIWLSKQPGYTTAQKAGSRQEVLAVVRHESYDTLENRVFKDFLRLCQREAKTYLDTYERTYPKSKRVIDVRRFLNLASSIFLLPVMSEVSQLKSNPHPNYVLQKNKSYATIWNLYQMILNKYHLIEDLWPVRHIIIKEYFALLFDDFLYNEFDIVLEGRYWIDAVNSKNKNGFLHNSKTLNYFTRLGIGYSSLYFTQNVNYEIVIKNTNLKTIRFPFFFIPYYVNDDVIAYNENPNTIPIVVDERRQKKISCREFITLNRDGNLITQLPENIVTLLREKI